MLLNYKKCLACLSCACFLKILNKKTAVFFFISLQSETRDGFKKASKKSARFTVGEKLESRAFVAKKVARRRNAPKEEEGGKSEDKNANLCIKSTKR